MSSDIKRMKEKAREESLDAKMNNILADITGIDDKIQRLSKQRETLVRSYEKLKDTKIIKEAQIAASNLNWENENFEWSQRLRETLKRVFKLDEFRPQQLQTINCIMSKNDVLLIAPTGGGKSLCYQLPAILNNGLTLIVSPLISLMEDQVWSLEKYGIDADLICSTTEPSKIETITRFLRNEQNSSKILYVTPERLAKCKTFMNSLQTCYSQKRLNLIAVDEVHCISQFGNDFRPDYKFLSALKTLFPNVPVLGVTATATTKVIVDTQKILNLRNPAIFRAEFNRPNLYYHVMEKPQDKKTCVELLYELLSKRYAGQSGIIYAFSQADTEELASELTQKRVKVRPYHAALTNDSRTKIHAKWLSGEIQAVVATVAFGMGIDKPDVRFVIHHTLSKSMENYYQESGRAGRDGRRAECILLYRTQDITRITTMVLSEYTGIKNAYRMVDFAIDGTSCRRNLISRHFAEVWNTSVECNKMCDRCYHEDGVNPPKMDIVEHCLTLYKIIDHASDMDAKLTILKLIDAWYQRKTKAYRLNDTPPPPFDQSYAEQIVAYLIIKDYLKEDFFFTAFTTISYIQKGGNLAEKGQPIIFQAARTLELPEIDDAKKKHRGISKRTEGFASLTDSDAPLEKRVKKEKKIKKEKRDESLNYGKNDGNSSRSNSLGLSMCSTKSDSNSKKKKKIKQELMHIDDSSSSDKADNDCVILVEGSDVIEID